MPATASKLSPKTPTIRIPRLAQTSGLVNGRVFQDNVFRGLGLSVLAGGRETAKRVEEFRLARELEVEVASWAFAPSRLWTLEQTRAAQQTLHEPARRLLEEVFWFWPQSYPEVGDDEALTALAANDAETAIALWADRQDSGDLAAFHNLAVYHHLIALEREQTATGDELTTWWTAALRFWQLTMEDATFWQRLRQRVADLADPQLPLEVVDELKANFRDLLAGINADLALRAAEADDLASVARQTQLLQQLYGSAEEASEALGRVARTLLQRIETQVFEAARSLEAASETDIFAIARALIERSGPEIQHLNTLCGRESMNVEPAGNLVGNVLLDAISAAQRAQGNAVGELMILSCARALPISADVRRRVEGFFNAGLEANVSTSELEPSYARLYTVVTEQLLKPWQAWDLSSAQRALVADQICELLRKVADQAVEERDDLGFALHAFQVLLQLPCSTIEKVRREDALAGLQRDFMVRAEHAVALTQGPYSFALDHRGLRWNEQLFDLERIRAVRFGSPLDEASGVRRWRVEFKVNDREIVLDGQNFFLGETGAEDFGRTVRAVEFFVLPKLVSRAVAEIQAETPWVLDDVTIAAEGVWLPSPSRLWKKPQLVPHHELQHRTELDAWTVTAGTHAQWQRKYLIVDTWNAVILGRVVAALAEKTVV